MFNKVMASAFILCVGFLGEALAAPSVSSWSTLPSGLLNQEEETMTIMVDLQNKGAQPEVVKEVYEAMRKQFIKAEDLGEVWREKSLGITSGQSIVDKCRGPENSACLLAWIKDSGARYLIAGRLRAMDDDTFIVEIRLLDVNGRTVINQVDGKAVERSELLNYSMQLACELSEDFGCAEEDLIVSDEVLAPVDPDAKPNPDEGEDEGEDDENLFSPQPNVVEEEPSEPYVWKDRNWGWVMVGVGAAAAATGSAMMVMAKGSYDKYQDATLKSDADKHRSDTETFAYTGYGMFALAGASAVGSTLLLLMLPDEEPAPPGSGGLDRPTFQVAPQVAPGFSGLLLQGELP